MTMPLSWRWCNLDNLNPVHLARAAAVLEDSKTAGLTDLSAIVTVPVAGFSYTVADRVGTLILDPAALLATGTITLPAAPLQNQIVRGATTQTITALTLAANVGQSIKNALTTLSLGSGFAYIYIGTTWYRVY